MEKETFSLYKSRCNELKEQLSEFFEYDMFECYNYFEDIMSEEEFNGVMKEKHNRSSKRSRTKSKLADMLKFYNRSYQNGIKYFMVFGTATLDNTYYLYREPRTRDKIMNQYLMKHYDVVLLNKDYGDLTEREHYHFIGLTTEQPVPVLDHKGKQRLSKKHYPLYELPIKDYKLGYNPTVEPIVMTDLDKLKNYLLKLNNHSNKVSTRQRLRHLKSSRYVVWEKLNSPTKKQDHLKNFQI